MKHIKKIFKTPEEKTPIERGRFGGTKVIKQRFHVNPIVKDNDETNPKVVFGEGRDASEDQGQDTDNSDDVYRDPELDNMDETETVFSEHLPDDDFVCPISVRKQNHSRGPRVRKCFLISNGYAADHITDEFVNELNKHSQSQTTDAMKKHALVTLIPRTEDVALLAKCLRCSDITICREVISRIQSKVFDTHDFSDLTKDLLKVEEFVWSFLETHTGNNDLVSEAGTLDLMLWSSVLSNDKEHDSECSKVIFDTTSERASRSKEFYKKKNPSTVSRDVFCTIYNYMDTCKDHLKCKGPLPLTNSESKVMSPNAKIEIQKLVEKSTVCEQYTFILRQLRIISSKTKDQGCLLDISNCLPKRLDRGTKHMFRILLLKGLVHSLTKTHTEELIANRTWDPVHKMCFVIQRVFEDNYFKSKSVNNHIIEIFLNIILPMVNHKSKTVRDTYIQIVRNFENITSFPDAFRRIVECKMSNCSLEIFPDSTYKEDGGCPMYQFAGMFGSMPVTTNILISNPQCISKGHIGRCIEKKKQETFKLQKNNIDVLQSLNSHSNIVQLVAFQIKPFPYFAIQEDLRGRCLNTRLLETRASRSWFSERDKLLYILDIISGLQYIHSRDIIVRNLTPISLILTEGKIKLADMSYACTPKEDMSPGNLPTLWLPWEAIWKGQFTKMSDVYALGLTAYGIWTHGCEPYTELYKKKREDILKLVMFHKIQPFQWACIPDRVHSLILRCTKHEAKERVELRVLKQEVQEMLKSTTTTVTRFRIQEVLDEDDMYPEISHSQKERKHVPEKGIPREIMHMRKKDPYVNQSFSMWIPSSIPQVQQRELSSIDNLTITEQVHNVLVLEPVTKDFVTDMLPYLKAENFTNTGGDMTPEPLNSFSETYPYTLESIYPFGKTLKEAAMAKELPEYSSIYDLVSDDISVLYLDVCLKVAERINEYHEHGWLHRDISAETILVANSFVDSRTFQVFMPRLGRMCKYPINTTQSGKFIKGKSFENRIRWLPAESIIDGVYSPQSDVYMWAVMCWEVLTLLHLWDNNPTRSEALSVPFCMVNEDEVVSRKLSGESLDRPISCPDWFYSLLQQCWQLNRSDRPNMVDIIMRMKEKLSTVPMQLGGGKPRVAMRQKPGRRQRPRVRLEAVMSEHCVANKSPPDSVSVYTASGFFFAKPTVRGQPTEVDKEREPPACRFRNLDYGIANGSDLSSCSLQDIQKRFSALPNCYAPMSSSFQSLTEEPCLQYSHMPYTSEGNIESREQPPRYHNMKNRVFDWFKKTSEECEDEGYLTALHYQTVDRHRHEDSDQEELYMTLR